MGQNISPQAATAREQARAPDGKFGAQPHDRVDGIELGAAPADGDWSIPEPASQRRAKQAASMIEDAQNERAMVLLAQQIRSEHPDAEHFLLIHQVDGTYHCVDAVVLGGADDGQRFYSDIDDDAIGQLYGPRAVEAPPLPGLEVAYEEGSDLELEWKDAIYEGKNPIGIWGIDEVASHQVDEGAQRRSKLAAKQEMLRAIAALDEELGEDAVADSSR